MLGQQVDEIRAVLTATDNNVIYPQLWPHLQLKNGLNTEGRDFLSLSLPEFIAGELEIIQMYNQNMERKGGLELLNTIALKAELYDWTSLLHWYAAWVQSIEYGHHTWADDFRNFGSMIMVLRKEKSKTERLEVKPKVRKKSAWLCPFFQKDSSFHKHHHALKIRGRVRRALHICSACWREKTVKVAHPKYSKICPLNTEVASQATSSRQTDDMNHILEGDDVSAAVNNSEQLLASMDTSKNTEADNKAKQN